MSRRVNQNSLVYNVTMDAGELRGAVDFSWMRDLVAPCGSNYAREYSVTGRGAGCVSLRGLSLNPAPALGGSAHIRIVLGY